MEKIAENLDPLKRKLIMIFDGDKLRVILKNGNEMLQEGIEVKMNVNHQLGEMDIKILFDKTKPVQFIRRI